MKCMLAVLVCVRFCDSGMSEYECNIRDLAKQLKRGHISYDRYTKLFGSCFGSHHGPPSKYGFQPSCFTDEPVTQAIVKIDNSGRFMAVDGSSHPFRIRVVVTFTKRNSKETKIQVTVSGLHNFLFDSNQFSVHVHQKGEINSDCSAPGGHYDPCGKNHSNDPSVEDRHVGDVAKETIPSHIKSENDAFTFTKIDTQVKLSGPLSVLGRSIVVHAGSTATRVGCGTIAVTEWEGENHPDSVYDSHKPFWQ